MAKNRKQKDTYRFDCRAYRFLTPIVRCFCEKKLHFQGERVIPSTAPVLVYVNHQCGAMDPVMVGSAFPRHMYFVSSEHILRRKWSKIFLKLTHPILRVKGKTDSASAMDILRHLKKGHSVCIFIEGERTWDGVTMDIAESSAHLVKLAGCGLITYTLHGGYMAHPRWSKEHRKGMIRGTLVKEYLPEELKTMSKEELFAAIRNDLYVDSYAEQREEKQVFHAEKPAEDLETALFLCPRCGRIGTLSSRWDRFECTCGMITRLDELGFFQPSEGQEPPFATVHDWFSWQKEQVPRLIEKGLKTDEPLLRDERQYLYECMGAKKDRLLGYGTLSLYADRLEFVSEDGEKLTAPLAELSDIACEEQTMMSFIYQGHIYELRTLHPRSSIKYQLYFRQLKQNALAAAK